MCLIVSALNSAVYLMPFIIYSPLQFQHYNMSIEGGEVQCWIQILTTGAIVWGKSFQSVV